MAICPLNSRLRKCNNPNYLDHIRFLGIELVLRLHLEDSVNRLTMSFNPESSHSVRLILKKALIAGS